MLTPSCNVHRKKPTMISKRRLLRSSIAAVLLLSVTAVYADDRSDDIVVVVNAKNTTKDMSIDMLRDVYMKRRTRWSDNTPIMVFTLQPRTPCRKKFERLVLGLSSREAAEYWIARRVRGQGTPPRSLSSGFVLLSVVAQQKGAIGYVSAKTLRSTRESMKKKIRVLRIGGKTPADSQYPLHASQSKTGD